MHTTLNAERGARSAEPPHPTSGPGYVEYLFNRKAAIENQKSEADWISTTEAGKISGYSRRSIQRFCDEGFFIEGVEWKQRQRRPGIDQGGHIRIKRSALKKLEGQG